MPIPESQLSIWSRQGATATSQATHEAIRHALSEWADLRNRNYEVYLQGSYKNSTNIRGSSDVDVIAQSNDSFYWNDRDLTPTQSAAHNQAYPSSASYPLAQFRRDVLNALRRHFGSNAVAEGNKSIKIARDSDRVPADVVVCAQYRRYTHFRSKINHSMAEGIWFQARNGQTIINYPKPHYRNGTAKNAQCPTSYKAGVRILKNARNSLIRKGWMLASDAPSYFLECFAYNAANHCYSGSWQNLYTAVLRDLTNGDYPEYMCQNNVRPLFGNSYDQWNYDHARSLCSRLWRLWDEW